MRPRGASRPEKGRRARNGPFPFKNYLCLEIRAEFYHFGPQRGRRARNGRFLSKTGLFLVCSTIAGHHVKKRKASSHPQTQTGIRLVWTSPACRPKSNCSRLEASRRPRATPKPKLAPVWSGQVQLADPNPIIQDWKQPVRAPSKKKPSASSHPQTQTGTRLVWTSPACRPRSNCSRLEATSQGTV